MSKKTQTTLKLLDIARDRKNIEKIERKTKTEKKLNNNDKYFSTFTFLHRKSYIILKIPVDGNYINHCPSVSQETNKVKPIKMESTRMKIQNWGGSNCLREVRRSLSSLAQNVW